MFYIRVEFELSGCNSRGGQANHLLFPALVPGGGGLDLRPIVPGLQRDDGAVIYLNGTEIFRTDLPAGLITFTNLASATIGGTDETNWLQAAITAKALTNGWSVLAAEVHQAAANSSDLRFDLTLAAMLELRLTITRSNVVHLLRWFAAAPGFRVQFNTTLGNTNWLAQSSVPVLRGESYELLVTNAPPRFYRRAAP
jgi:hypothetical protein